MDRTGTGRGSTLSGWGGEKEAPGQSLCYKFLMQPHRQISLPPPLAPIKCPMHLTDSRYPPGVDHFTPDHLCL